MKVFVVLRHETEWQEFIGVYSTVEKAQESAERNKQFVGVPGKYGFTDSCRIVEAELDTEQQKDLE